MKAVGTVGVVVVFVLLAGSAAYFATKSIILQGKLATSGESVADSDSTPEETASSTPTSTATSSASPSASTSTPVTPPAVAAKDRLATPSTTYTVVEGDTLYPIGLELDVNWEQIAQANNLVDPYTLKVGQVLIIPTLADSTYSVRYTVSPSVAQKYQTNANQGQDTWRLDPTASAQAEVGGAWGLATTDEYRLVSRDDTAGTAVVTASRLEGSVVKSYEITLNQPVTKGSTGIWSIERVTPKK